MAITTVEFHKTEFEPKRWAEILEAFCQEPVVEMPPGGDGPGECRLHVVTRIELGVKRIGLFDDDDCLITEEEA